MTKLSFAGPLAPKERDGRAGDRADRIGERHSECVAESFCSCSKRRMSVSAPCGTDL